MSRQSTSINWRRAAGATLLLGALGACQSARLTVAIPAAFQAEATEMRVKGANGWPINERVRFGNFKSSRIRRGWNTTSSRRTGNWSEAQLQDLLYQRFGVGTQELSTRQKDKFRFEMELDGLFADVFAREQRLSNSTEVRTNTILGSWERVQNYQYDFSASIIPDRGGNKDVWQLQLTNVYDRNKDTARRFFDQPYVEEYGLATNGADSIEIRTLYVAQYQNKQGQQGNMPFRIPSGYQLKWDGGLVCVVDTMGRKIWMHNQLEPQDKLLLGAMAMAILLRRIEQ